jgi:hypothetical protein
MALAHLAQLAQLAQPAHLARLSQTSSGLGRSTDPAQPLILLSLLSSSLVTTGSSPPPPSLSGQLRWSSLPPPWAKYSPPRPLPSPPNGIVGHLLSEEIWVVFPLGICCLRTPSMRCLTVLEHAELAELAELALVLVPHDCSPVEAPRCGAPGACLVKTSPGSLWLAAQALPCHAIQTSTWAIGEYLLLLSNPLLLSLATVSDQLVKIGEPGSQTLLCAAVCLMLA